MLLVFVSHIFVGKVHVSGGGGYVYDSSLLCSWVHWSCNWSISGSIVRHCEKKYEARDRKNHWL